MENQGKKFERQFKDSIPINNEIFYYRFKDGTASWNMDNNKVRFQAKNICDCMIFYKGKLFLNELKSHKGKSLPLNCIRENQIKDLFDASLKNNVYCNILVFFSDTERCFSLNIQDVVDYMDSETAKSIPISYFEKYGREIKVSKLRTNYRFDIESWLNIVEDYFNKQKKQE